MNRTFKTAAQIFPNIAASIYDLNFTYQPIFEKTKQTNGQLVNGTEIVSRSQSLFMYLARCVNLNPTASSQIRIDLQFRAMVQRVSIKGLQFLTAFEEHNILLHFELAPDQQVVLLEGKSGQQELLLEFKREKKTFFFTKLSIS